MRNFPSSFLTIVVSLILMSVYTGKYNDIQDIYVDMFFISLLISGIVLAIYAIIKPPEKLFGRKVL